MKNNKSTHRVNNQIEQQHDSRLFWRCVCGLVGGILLAAGFVFAAGKHFDAIQHSTKNVELRERREQLKSDKQRLIIERESALSPAQLEKHARRIGMQNVDASQINRLDEMLRAEEAAKSESAKKQSAKQTIKTPVADSKSAKAGKNESR